jgi:hypothetical protein
VTLLEHSLQVHERVKSRDKDSLRNARLVCSGASTGVRIGAITRERANSVASKVERMFHAKYPGVRPPTAKAIASLV